MGDFVCQTCGSPFQRKGTTAKFCSKTCANRRTQTEWECTQCGEKFIRPRSRLGSEQRQFCSKECFGKWRNDTPLTKFVCIVCSKIFERPTYLLGTPREPKFCSLDCFGASRKKHFSDKEKHATEINTWRQSLGWRSFRTNWIKAHPKCDECGIEKNGRNLVVHHKQDPNKDKSEELLFRPSNLEVLCRSCHSKAHGLSRWYS